MTANLKYFLPFHGRHLIQSKFIRMRNEKFDLFFVPSPRACCSSSGSFLLFSASLSPHPPTPNTPLHSSKHWKNMSALEEKSQATDAAGADESEVSACVECIWRVCFILVWLFNRVLIAKHRRTCVLKYLHIKFSHLSAPFTLTQLRSHVHRQITVVTLIE